MRFRLKPIEVMACRVLAPMTIETDHGTVIGKPGDWLVTGDDGKQYFCQDDNFQAKFEPIQDTRKKPTRKSAGGTTTLPKLAEIWNQHCGAFRKVTGCGGERLKSANARWQEMPDETHWIEIIERIKKSPFCSGQNDRGWKANFDFLIRPNTRFKVLEGTYDGHRTSAKVLDLGVL
jgi:hypothetical protein